MATNVRRPIADFKMRPSSSVPMRQGPLQCIRNCPNCTSRSHIDTSINPSIFEQKRNTSEDDFDENMANMKGYVNLLINKNLAYCPYQTVQYHPGQLELLKWRIKTRQASSQIVYIVAVTDYDDLEYFKLILAHERVKPAPNLPEAEAYCTVVPDDKATIIPISLKSCHTHQNTKRKQLQNEGALNKLKLYVDDCLKNQQVGQDALLVPVVISKDHDRRHIYSVGSLCIQVHEPYSFQNLLRTCDDLPRPADFVMKHIQHDLLMNYPLLPSHIVAFILMGCEEEVSAAELIDYYLWLDKNRLAFNLHLAFTGTPESVIEFGLHILREYVECRNGRHKIKNYDAICDYMERVLPNVTPLGMMAQAVLAVNYAYNEDCGVVYKFEPDVRLRVLKDETIKSFIDISTKYDDAIPFRKPCVDRNEFAERALDNIITHFRYFKLDIPMRFKRDNAKMRWGFDIEEDEVYRETQSNNPIFKDWINVTQNEKRLKQLNLCVTALDNMRGKELDQEIGSELDLDCMVDGQKVQ